MKIDIDEEQAEYANNDSATDDCAIVRVPVNTALPHDGVHKLCSAHVHCITNPVNYARNQARQQQAEEAARGQHLSEGDFFLSHPVGWPEVDVA